MPITDFLKEHAQRKGNEVSLVEVNPQLPQKEKAWREFDLVEAGGELAYRKELTWKAFDEMVNRFANLLLERGVKRTDKVAVLLMNCIEWLPLYFGVLRSGALVVPLNYRYTAEEIKYCLELADVSVLVFGPEFVGRMEEIKDRIPEVTSLFYLGEDAPAFAEKLMPLVAAMPPQEPTVPLKDDDDAAIYFSSGTTGFPKAILHKHRSLMHAALCEQAHHGQQEEDVFLCIPPLYHTGAKMHWFGSLVAGGRSVLLRGTSPRWILEAAAAEKASIVWLLVPWAQDILDAIDSGEVDLEAFDFSHWRLMHIGAQPVPPSLIRRWKQVFPNHAYDTNYGLSESIGPGSVHLGVENIHKVGAIGKAGFGWQTKIANEQGEAVKPGEVGELALAGPGLMTCYYKDDEATAAVLRDGWLFTGDMAREDEDGFIYLVDRKKDVIIMGGENIYPVQIEDFLRGHADIKDCAVIGLAHERLGEVAAAVIELKPGATCTEEAILAFCEPLPRYKRPRKVIFDVVPRNPTGKIEKPKLREKYCGGSLVRRQIENGNGAKAVAVPAGQAVTR